MPGEEVAALLESSGALLPAPRTAPEQSTGQAVA
jgi:hypothetical protein